MHTIARLCLVAAALLPACRPAEAAGAGVPQRREQVLAAARQGAAGLAALQQALKDESPLVRRPAIRALAARDEPLAAILWGNDARQAEQWLPDVPVITSPHPSPLSASRGFFGSRPFSRVNEELLDLGADPVDWRLP